MKPILTFVALFWSLAITAAPPADKPDIPAVDPVQSAFDKLVRGVTETKWSSELEARNELTSLGQKVVPKLAEAARNHSEFRVRRACYDLLTSTFAKDEQAIDAVIQYGLRDQDAGIRYICAFLQGDLKVYKAKQALRSALQGATGKDDEFFVYTVAKSLAQLGEADVLPALFTAVSDDSAMTRHVGNIGLKGLSGKNLEDFEGYHYFEGTSVIGGFEVSTGFDAITSVENRAQRFHAATAYFRGLKSERPELYEYVTYRYGGGRSGTRTK